MGYTATGPVLEHVTALVCQERPEWDPALVRLVLHAHTALVDGTDLAVAALRCAADRYYLTPKAIGWRGRHWDGLDSKPLEARTGPRCSVCGKPEPRCYGERPGPDDHAFEPSSS